MTEGNIVQKIISFAFPLLLSSLFQQFYNLADTVIVSQNLGEQALAAVGATSVISSLLISFACGLNSGYGIMISRFFGAKDQKAVQKSVAAMIELNIAITIVLTAASVGFIRTAMLWLGTPEDIFDPAYRYITIILAGLVTTVCYNMWDGFLRAIGNSRTSLCFLIVACLLNVLLDMLFIAKFGWGVEGAALATVLAQGVSGILSGIYIFRKYKLYLPSRSDFGLDWNLAREMFTTGLTMGLMLSVTQLGSIILQRAINHLGTTIITAHTAARKITEFMMTPLATLANANAIFVSQNFGAGKYDRIRNALKKVWMLEIIWVVVSLAVAFLFGKPIIQYIANSTNPQIVENASNYLCVSVLFFFPLAILFVFRTSFQSLGYKVSPVISSAIELFGKVVASLFVIPRTGYWMVMATEPITWVLCAVFLLIFFQCNIKKKISI